MYIDLDKIVWLFVRALIALPSDNCTALLTATSPKIFRDGETERV